MPRLAALILVLLTGCSNCTCKPVAVDPQDRKDGPFVVKKVVDGDTIHVQTGSGVQKVRFLCIDTPEVSGESRSPLGDSATASLIKIIGDQKVYLKRDDTHDDADRYGRLLRHVFLWDNTHVNVEMVRLGWSAYYTKFGPCHRHHDEFTEAEQQASRNVSGIWGHPEFLRGGYLTNARGQTR